jgi:hypothetical protein
MTDKLPEPYFDPVSQGFCEVLSCSNPAKFRASWAKGIIIKLVCVAHRSDVEEKVFSDLSPSTFGGSKRRAR